MRKFISKMSIHSTYSTVVYYTYIKLDSQNHPFDFDTTIHILEPNDSHYASSQTNKPNIMQTNKPTKYHANKQFIHQFHFAIYIHNKTKHSKVFPSLAVAAAPATLNNYFIFLFTILNTAQVFLVVHHSHIHCIIQKTDW